MPNLNHEHMIPPFLQQLRRRQIAAGHETVVWELRVSQPNIAHVPTDYLHSLEHFLIYDLWDASDKVTLAAAMMCQTGYFIDTINITDFDEMADLVVGVLNRVLGATEVPGANTQECGRADHHSLDGAKQLAGFLLMRRTEWSTCLIEPDPNTRATAQDASLRT